MRKADMARVVELLAGAYGDKAWDRTWDRRLDPAGELVLTILSQNTSDTNSRKAYGMLTKRFSDWDKVAKAGTGQIAEAIRTGGLAEVKARYIKSALLSLQKEPRGFDLSFLKDMEINEARRWLTRLPGVGMKTASCVLLFSLGLPAFPVDTHVLRVTRRLGLIKNKVPADTAHLEMERLTRPDDVYRGHVLLIEHGRRTCKAQRPLCRDCVLSAICPSYRLFLK